jgi:hypothetical protein
MTVANNPPPDEYAVTSIWPNMFENKIQPTTELSEARAKIIWGEPPAAVRDYLLQKGLSPEAADAKVREFVRERNAEIRLCAVQKILLGSALLIFAGSCICFLSTAKRVSASTSGGKAFGTILLAGFYGLWKLVDGLFYFIRPQADEESVSDLEV